MHVRHDGNQSTNEFEKYTANITAHFSSLPQSTPSPTTPPNSSKSKCKKEKEMKNSNRFDIKCQYRVKCQYRNRAHHCHVQQKQKLEEK